MLHWFTSVLMIMTHEPGNLNTVVQLFRSFDPYLVFPDLLHFVVQCIQFVCTSHAGCLKGTLWGSGHSFPATNVEVCMFMLNMIQTLSFRLLLWSNKYLHMMHKVYMCSNLFTELELFPFFRWEAGPKEFDGIWAPWWYGRVHKSTGFSKSRQYPSVSLHQRPLLISIISWVPLSWIFA